MTGTRSPPCWPPRPLLGTGHGQRLPRLTQGFLVGEVVRRITGRSLGTVFRQEIAEPWEPISISACRLPRTGVSPISSRRRRVRRSRRRADPIAGQHVAQPRRRSRDTRTRAWRAAEIPAAGGQGNAARSPRSTPCWPTAGSPRASGSCRRPAARKALELQIEGTDLILAMPARFGLGSVWAAA